MTKQLIKGVFNSIKLNEVPYTDEIFQVELLRVGEFMHPFAPDGKIVFDKAMLQKLKLNYDRNVRKAKDNELPIDYAHESYSRAAGWIKSIELRNDDTELWIKCEWTPDAHKAISEKEWRYISADIDLEYMDNESAVEFGPTLMGAGLTNRPHIKDMQAIFNEQNPEYQEDGNMPKDLESMMQKISELEAIINQLKDELKGKDEMMAEKEKMMMEKDQQLSEAKTTIENGKKEAKFNELLNDGKILPAQKEDFMQIPLELADKLFSKAIKLNLENAGHGKDQDGSMDKVTVDNVEDKIIELSEAKAKKENISFSMAQRQILNENKDLEKLYNEKFNM